MLRPIFVFIGNLVRLLGYLWSHFWYRINKWLRGDNPLYVRLDIEEDYLFGPPGGLGSWLRSKPTLIELYQTVDRLESESAIDGVIVTADGTNLGAAQIDELTRQFDSLRESGKHLVAHTQMAQTSDYLLMSAADDILLSPSGRLYTFGPRFDQYFGSEALSTLGVRPQFIHIGEYKTAAHRFTRQAMSSPQKKMMESLHQSLYDLHLERFASRRHISMGRAEKIFSEPPLNAESATYNALIDGEVFRRQVPDWLRHPQDSTPLHIDSAEEGDDDEGEKQDDDAPWPIIVDADEMVGSLPKPFFWKPLFASKPTIGIVDLSGMIVMPETPLPGGQSQPTIDPESVSEALEELAYNPRYDGALLHINSPGGSALASDIIWQQVKELAENMPVVAYCSDVAASGGYYLASGADNIVCHRFTVTGSIGVVTGQFSVPETPKKLGLNIESIYKNETDTFTSPFHPLSEDLLEDIQKDARQFYRRFLRRVGEARQLPRRRLHRYSRGRVYTGPQAEQRDLVDKVGDSEDALQRLCDMADIGRDEAMTEFVPHRTPSIGDVLRNKVSMPERGKITNLLEEPVKLAEWLKQEPVLALMPYRMTYK